MAYKMPARYHRYCVREGKLSQWLMGLLCTLGLIGFVGIITLVFGLVRGVEFSPDAFQRRSFTYYQLPVFGIQIWPIKRTDITGGVEKHLSTTGVIPALPPNQEPLWHLANIHHGPARGRDGDSQILLTCLDIYDNSGNLLWLEWSKSNPKLAPILWGAVRELALGQLYVLVPELLVVAQQGSDAKDFQKQIDIKLAELYRDSARLQKGLGRSKRAAELVQRALKHTPEEGDFRNELLDLQKEFASLSP